MSWNVGYNCPKSTLLGLIIFEVVVYAEFEYEEDPRIIIPCCEATWFADDISSLCILSTVKYVIEI